MKNLLTLIIIVISATQISCRKGKPRVEEELPPIPNNIFRGVPSELTGVWSAPCDLSDKCVSELKVQIEGEKITIVFFYTEDERVHGVKIGPHKLENNNIIDSDGFSIGAIGHGGLFFTRPDIGQLSATRLETGELVLVIENKGRKFFAVDFPARTETSKAPSEYSYFEKTLTFFSRSIGHLALPRN